MITAELLRAAVGCTAERAETFAGPLSDACALFEINTQERLAPFLANVGHESGSFRWVSEIWGPTPAQERYEGRKDLGNTEPGDGAKFRGRGLIQTTGRANYRELRPALLLAGYEDVPDFEADPEQLQLPRWAAASAAFFWHSRGLNELADAGDFGRIVRRINGGTNGMADREQRLARARAALGASTTTATAPEPVRGIPAGEIIPEEPAMDPITGGFMLGLAKDLIGAFTPLAKAKAEKELARHTDPQMAAQIAGNFIEAAVSATGKAGAVDAVSEAKRDPAVIAKVESESMASIEKVLPLMERLNVMEQQNIAAARKFASDEPFMLDTPWLKLKFIHVLSLLFIAFSGWFVTQNWSSLTPELRGAVITLMIIAGWNGVKDFWMGSSSDSQRKTALLK